VSRLVDFTKYDKDASGAEVDAATALELRRLVANGRPIEDIDMEGRFWDPPGAALSRMTELHMESARRRGWCDCSAMPASRMCNR